MVKIHKRLRIYSLLLFKGERIIKNIELKFIVGVELEYGL